MAKVLISEHLEQVPAEWLATLHEVVYCRFDHPDFDTHLANADAMVVRTYTNVNAELLAKASALKVIARAGVGLDNFDLPACQQAGVEVVYAPESNTQAVVEYITGWMIDWARPRYRLTSPVSAEEFHGLRKIHAGKELAELTLGIVGMGRIGCRMAQVGKALGMRVIGCDILPEIDLQARLVANGIADVPCMVLDVLMAEADLITLHTDGRKENTRMMGAAQFSAMKPEAIFMNAARGVLVDEQALAQHASVNQSQAFYLDVFAPEPPAEDHPFYACKNVHMYPHLASRTHAATERMGWVVKDVNAVLRGEPPVWSAL